MKNFLIGVGATAIGVTIGVVLGNLVNKKLLNL